MAETVREDVNRPLDLEQCGRGWRSQREYSYWIPEADVEGKIPNDLIGTFFRNGPGVDEVYGTKLVHRKYKILQVSFTNPF